MKTNKDFKKVLNFAWEQRLKLRAEGSKLWAEGDKLWAEGSKLWAEGSKLWAEAILKTYGNIKLEWKWNDKTEGTDCILETGDAFKYKEAGK